MAIKYLTRVKVKKGFYEGFTGTVIARAGSDVCDDDGEVIKKGSFVVLIDEGHENANHYGEKVHKTRAQTHEKEGNLEVL